MDRGKLSTAIDLLAAPSGSEVYTSSCLKEHLRLLEQQLYLQIWMSARVQAQGDNENYITPAAADFTARVGRSLTCQVRAMKHGTFYNSDGLKTSVEPLVCD